MKQLSTLCVLAMTMLLSAQGLATDSTRHLNEFVVSAKRSLRPASISKIEAPLAQIPITVNTLTAEGRNMTLSLSYRL